MSDIRKEFEKIPYVKAILDGVHSSIVWFSEDKYHTSFVGFDGAVNRLNWAWVVYQNQQAKVEGLQKRVDAIKQLIQDYLDEEKELELKEWEQSTIYGRIAIELEQALKGEAK